MYEDRSAELEGNKGAIYALLMDGVLKIIKSKLKSKTRYLKADEANDYVWLLDALEDIMIKNKEVKPKNLEIDEHMVCIMKLKQGESTNEDVLNQVQKELDAYKKHGGAFLWGDAQDTELARQVQNENFTYGVENTCSHENMNRWRYTLHACARRQVRERNYKVHGY